MQFGAAQQKMLDKSFRTTIMQPMVQCNKTSGRTQSAAIGEVDIAHVCCVVPPFFPEEIDHV
jgi:hypothetical protein